MNFFITQFCLQPFVEKQIEQVYEAINYMRLTGDRSLLTLRDRNNWDILDLAVYLGNERTVRDLIALGAEIHQIRQRGHNPLCIAVCQGHEDIVRFLIGLNVPLDDQDEHGRTALMFAAELGRANIISLLLDAGAESALQDNYGYDAMDYAISNVHLQTAVRLCGIMPRNCALALLGIASLAGAHALYNSW